MRRTACCSVAVMALAAYVVSAQMAEFEVATIKPAGTASGSTQTSPDRFYRPRATLRALIGYAFDLPLERILGGPEWMRSQQWEVSAKAHEVPSPPEMRQMVAALLQDRFALRTHREARQVPGYELVLARADGRLGSGLKPAGACKAFTTRERPLSEAPRDSRGVPDCFGMINFGDRTVVRLADQTLSAVVRLVESEFQRPAVDRTGLSGTFDISFDFRRAGLKPRDDTDIPELATALEESLGLRVRETRADVDMLVVDSAQLPTAN